MNKEPLKGIAGVMLGLFISVGILGMFRIIEESMKGNTTQVVVFTMTMFVVILGIYFFGIITQHEYESLKKRGKRK